MKVKFNKFERVAGLFVLIAVGISFAATVGMGIKKGWFDPKVRLVTYLPSAEGINPGSPVRFSGLRIGSINSIDLISSNEVQVEFKVLKRFAKRINTNSEVHVVRPFVIGEKVLEIHDGKTKGEKITDGTKLVAVYSPDLLEIIGSSKLGLYMESLSTTMGNLQKLAEAFLSNERSDKIIQLFDELFPLMENMHSMASEVSTLTASLNEQQKMVRVLDDFLVISKTMNKALPEVADDMPALSGNILKLTENLNQLSADMSEMVPIFKEIAPEIPAATRKAVRALDETVITLKAAQKTWMLRSNVKEVKEEEASRMRAPASQ